MAHFYLDEDIPHPVGDMLARRGHDFVHTYDVGNRSLTDPQQLLFAANAGRIIVTFNRRDFAILHQFWTALNAWGQLARQHSGILTTWGQVSTGQWADLIDDFVGQGRNLDNQMWAWQRQQGYWQNFDW